MSAGKRIETLLEAGAILPAGTEVAKRDVSDVLTARVYRHPALDDRTVVRLVSRTLGDAEDLAMEFLLFERAEEPQDVGVIRQQALGFPAWALVNDPANGHHALALVKEIEKLSRTAKTRIGAAKDGFVALGERLARAVPHFLPTYYEEAGRAFLVADSPTYAAMMFGKAREAEAIYALEVDAERQHTVFLEFALAGALTAKSLSAYAKDLAGRAEPTVAYESFHRLCAERILGGMPPYAAMHTDLRKLAKGAGMSAVTADDRVIGDLIACPVIARAPEAFWKAYRPALARLAAKDPTVRGILLGMMAFNVDDGDWLALLGECGATEVLTAEVQPDSSPADSQDGPAGWLSRFLTHRNRQWRGATRLPGLLDLVERMAPRLVADGTPVTLGQGYHQIDLDVADLALTLDIPVTVSDQPRLNLWRWLDDDQPGHRDLVALAVDERFLTQLMAAVENVLLNSRSGDGPASPERLRQVLAVPGPRTATEKWLDSLAHLVTRCGIPDLKELLTRVSLIADPEAIAVNPEALRVITTHDLVPVLGRTLRAGILAEYGWPALEEALTRVAEVKRATGDDAEIVFTAQWPHLIVSRGDLNLVLGPEGIVFEHHSRIPADERSYTWGMNRRFVDGQMLMAWYAGGEYHAYWSGTPDDVFVVGSDAFNDRSVATSLAIPGGRTLGGRPLRVGDRFEQSGGGVLSDGVTFWLRGTERGPDGEDKRCLREFDPATGTVGRICLPTFFESGDAAGGPLRHRRSYLRPVDSTVMDSPFGVAGGLVGWRASFLPGGGLRGRGIDGRDFTLSSSEATHPDLIGALRFPGADTCYGAVYTENYRNEKIAIIDADGFLVGRYSLGNAIPPVAFWHYLRPRDRQGSLTLRALTDDQAARLLSGTVELLSHVVVSDEASTRELEAGVRDLVRATVPGIADEALLVGVADLVLTAARRAVTTRAFEALAISMEAGIAEQPPTGEPIPEDPLTVLINTCLNGATERLAPSRWGQASQILPYFRTLGQALTGSPEGVDGFGLTTVDVDWVHVLGTLPAAMIRAVSPATPREYRQTLLRLLEVCAASGLCQRGSALRMVTLTAPTISVARGDIVECDGRRLLIRSVSDDEPSLNALEYSLDGRFSAIPGYTITSETRTVPGAFDPEDIEAFVALATEHDRPFQTRPAEVERLSELAGISRAEAMILAAAIPPDPSWEHESSAEYRASLGLAPTIVDNARSRLGSFSWQDYSALLARMLPDPVEALWSDGPNLEAVAEAWTAQHGRRTPVSDEVIAEVGKMKIVANVSEYLHGLGSPAQCRWLESAVKHIDDQTLVQQLAVLVPALAYVLPASNPIRQALPEAIGRFTQRLKEPTMALTCGYVDPHSVDTLISALGVQPVTVQTGIVAGPIHIRAESGWRQVTLYPGKLSGPADPAIAILRAHLGYGGGRVVDDLLFWLDGSIATMAGDPASEAELAAVAGGDSHNPLISAPDLVETVAGATGLSVDAAALYLQILALPDPTDRNVARWMGWKPARLKAARAELAASDHVVEAKRPRAGRSLFLPCGWVALSAPPLPIERWKLEMIMGGEAGIVSKKIAIPVATIPRLFYLAWERVTGGDGPRYDELVTERRR